MAESIKNNILNQCTSVSDFVPDTSSYYERLIGKYDGSQSIKEYMNNVIKEHLENLIEWDQYDGLLYSLLMTCHPTITNLIPIDHVATSTLIKLFGHLEKAGDSASILGAIELGIHALSSHPEIEESLQLLIVKMRDGENDEFGVGLFSAIIVLVDGELSRIKLFQRTPPFYRRLASFTNAALVHRALIGMNLDVKTFCEWIYANRGINFYLQTYVDMRLEPRWLPELVLPSQIMAEFIGRIILSSENHKINIMETQTYKLIIGDDQNTLQSRYTFPECFKPGPLEGADDLGPEIPGELRLIVEKQLYSDEIGPGRFFALLNSALIFKLEQKYTEAAANILKDKHYHLNNIENKSELISILSGLAILAAITRSTRLADELKILLRVYRNDKEYKLEVNEIIRFGLEAAASYSDLSHWCSYVGKLFDDLAFSDLTLDDAKTVHAHLRHITDCVPLLWRTCAKADAALQAFVASCPRQTSN